MIILSKVLCCLLKNIDKIRVFFLYSTLEIGQVGSFSTYQVTADPDFYEEQTTFMWKDSQIFYAYAIYIHISSAAVQS